MNNNLTKQRKVNILGVTVDNLALETAVEEVEQLITAEGQLVVTPNPEMIMEAQRDCRLREILNSAQLALPDGIGVVWAAQILGQPLLERIAGIDLVQELLARGAAAEYNFYFLGAKPGVAEQAKEKVKQQYPELTIYTHHGYLDRAEEQQVIQEINCREIDILLVGMGVPRQEKWLAYHLPHLTVGVGIGVGGAFDVLAGKKQRAPQVLQQLGLEWLHRLYQEPKRWRRMINLPLFMYYVGRQKLNIG